MPRGLDNPTDDHPDAGPGDLEAVQAVASLLKRCGLATRWLTVAGAASYASLSADSIRRLIEAGGLRGYRPVKGRILVDRLELDRLILASGSTARPQRGRGIRSQNQKAKGGE